MSAQHLCTVCSRSCSRKATICRACYRQQRATVSLERRTCPDCGGLRFRAQNERCRPCFVRSVQANVPRCGDCGKRVSTPTTLRCATCHNQARREAVQDINGVLVGFSATAFRALLERPDLEWTPRQLAERSGVSSRAINTWLSGERRPRRHEWTAVARVLALDVCQECHGLGTLDPTDQQIQRLAAAVVRRPLVTATREPLEAAAFGNLDLEPNARRMALGDRQLTLTRQEYRLLARLIEAQGQYVTSAALAEAIWQPEQSPQPHPRVARTTMARLRDKFEWAGIAWPVQTAGRSGVGYRLEVSA
jgi:helix-turn-helix protein